MSTCKMCKGDMTLKTTNFPVDLGSKFILVKDVPAMTCTQCGEYFLDDSVAMAVEKIVNDAQTSTVEIGILRYVA